MSGSALFYSEVLLLFDITDQTQRGVSTTFMLRLQYPNLLTFVRNISGMSQHGGDRAGTKYFLGGI
jgi:hypothetical protein